MLLPCNCKRKRRAHAHTTRTHSRGRQKHAQAVVTWRTDSRLIILTSLGKFSLRTWLSFPSLRGASAGENGTAAPALCNMGEKGLGLSGVFGVGTRFHVLLRLAESSGVKYPPLSLEGVPIGAGSPLLHPSTGSSTMPARVSSMSASEFDIDVPGREERRSCEMLFGSAMPILKRRASTIFDTSIVGSGTSSTSCHTHGYQLESSQGVTLISTRTGA